MLSSSKQFERNQTLIHELRGISERINRLFKLIDPAAHETHVKLDAAIQQKYNAARALKTNDPFLWLGRSIIFNRTTPVHPDNNEMPQGWVPLLTLGSFTGGKLSVPALGAKLFYEPGTLVFIRGRALEHGVEHWEGEQRVCIAGFSHESVYAEFPEIVLPF